MDEVKQHKHLGLTISNKLSWNTHIENILNSVSPFNDVLKRLKYQLDRKTLETVYFSFVLPKIHYGCHIWDNCSTKHSDLLEQFQLNIGQTVCRARKGTSHRLKYEELGWPKLSERRNKCKLKFFSGLINETAPEYLCNLLPRTVGESRILRNANNYKIPNSQTQLHRSSLLPSSAELWNKLDSSNRNNAYINSLCGVNCNPLFYLGPRETAIKHAQLRMSCSWLNGHLYNLHVIESPTCNCGHNNEDTNHYLLDCPLYIYERNILFGKIRNDGITVITEQILLYGAEESSFDTNASLFGIVFEFLEKTDIL